MGEVGSGNLRKFIHVVGFVLLRRQKRPSSQPPAGDPHTTPRKLTRMVETELLAVSYGCKL